MRSMQILAASLAAATVFAVSAPAALANGDHGKGQEKWEHRQKQTFEDLAEAAWAELNIEKAYQLGLMVGEGAGKFNPKAPITREAAVLTAIRLMGLESQAQSEARAELHFTDDNKVDAWARGAVAVAVEKNILPPAGDGQLRPRDPASRLWVSVLLVKALGYDAEAQSKMSVQLPFNDAAAIPANLVGYVAAAVDHHLVTGYNDHTFQPNKPVTRAEMAALLGRTDDQLSQRGERKGELHGTVQAVDATTGSLTVKGINGTVTASVASDAAIYVNSQAAELSSVQVGMSVWVKLNADMQITLVDARTPDNGGGNGGGGSTIGTTVGTVTAVVLPNNGILGVVSIQPASGSPITASVAPLATITGPGGAALSLAGIHVGDAVQAQVVAGIIISLTVTTPVPPVTTTTAQGQVYTIAYNPSTGTGSIVIVPDGGGASVSAAIYSTTTVTQLNADGTTTARSLTDVATGNEVKLTMQGGAATSIQIIAPAVTVQGKVMAFVAPTASSAGSLVFLPDNTAAATTYSIAANVPVMQGTTVKTFAELTLNRAIRLTIQGGTVVRIDLV